MKTTLLAAAAATAALFAAAPSFALDYTPNGYVGVGYSYDHITATGGDLNANTIDVTGVTNVKVAGPLNLQLDGDYQHTDLSDGAGSYNGGGANAHLYMRTENGAYGFVGGARRDSDVTVGNFGAQGEQFFDKFTVSEDVLNQWTDTKVQGHLTTITLGGHYYLTDNFRLDADAGYDRPSVEGKFANGWDLGVGAEYRLAKLPVSAYAKFDYADFGRTTLRDTAVHVGFRWNFDGSLKARERSGAAFAPAAGSDFGHLMGGLF